MKKIALCLICFASRLASAQVMMEAKLLGPTGSHPFLLNPAAFRPAAIQAELLIVRSSGHNTLDEDRDGDARQTKSEQAESTMGAGITTNLGSGLWAGFNLQQMQREDQSRLDSNRDRRVDESVTARVFSFKAAVEVIDNLVVGFGLRFAQVSYDLVGSFSVDPARNKTNFQTTLFGANGGVHYQRGPFVLGAAFLPPLKGKAEVLGEEKLVSEPGIVEISIGSATGKGTAFAGSYRRWAYKKDDRGAGTTLNDANDTAINLYGVNVRRSQIFLLNQLQIGVSHSLSNRLTLDVTAAKSTAEYNVNPADTVPGSDAALPHLSIYNLWGVVAVSQGKLRFQAGFGLGRAEGSVGQRNTKRQYKEETQDIVLGAGTVL